VFALNTDGSGFSVLHHFDSTNGSGPLGALALGGGTLYGTTRIGGTNGLGTVFALSTAGDGFVRLHSFGGVLQHDASTGLNKNSGGAFPETDLVLVGSTLYGATEQGGSGGNGTLFKINTDGSGFALMHNFTNVDGGYPSVHMVVVGTNLYGTTEFGGTGSFLGNGTIFRVNLDGTGFTNIYEFTDSAVGPLAGLVASGNTLYGTTTVGSGGLGGPPFGTLFKINIDGTGFTNFYALDYNLDASSPTAGLAIAGNQLYGTELGYAAYGDTVFQINTDGSGYTNLTGFNSQGDPGKLTGVAVSGGKLFGTASTGGAHNSGILFSVALSSSPVPIPLGQSLVGHSLVLTWADPAFSLYAAPVPAGPYTNVPNAQSPYTNNATGGQKYFRLRTN
ncbi:MAG TPA: choice-of-anchor tandem repeat GloVer-containing protein, partial [Verrucomicrobiae bacterium]|nr:choice-of-anchor tandem repeat GloVer-containing protein [Verrucomicrobiae bacterium]